METPTVNNQTAPAITAQVVYGMHVTDVKETPTHVQAPAITAKLIVGMPVGRP